MFDEAYYQDILAKYPETISKEQIYKLCHISKRVAKYYLDHGIIPCTNTGHATHKYAAKTTDVVAFLRLRNASPDAYRVTVKNCNGYHPIVHPSVEYTPAVMKRYRQMLNEILVACPDLMTVQMIANATGYSVKTIHTWTPLGYLRWFRNGSKYYAPKETVISHMMSEEFRNIINKSKKHWWMIAQLASQVNKEIAEKK